MRLVILGECRCLKKLFSPDCLISFRQSKWTPSFQENRTLFVSVGGDGANGRTKVGKFSTISFIVLSYHRQFSHLVPLVLSKAIQIGIGTFTATGLILLGGQYLHQKYRHHRDLQLIQQSDTLFSSTQSPLPFLVPADLGIIFFQMQQLRNWLFRVLQRNCSSSSHRLTTCSNKWMRMN